MNLVYDPQFGDNSGVVSFAPIPHFGDPMQVAVDALVTALRVVDDETYEHAHRVADLALDLTQLISPDLAAEVALHHAFLLHDIGKIAVPKGILLKTQPLNQNERRILESHTTLGGRIVDDLLLFPTLVRDLVICHHERWDGCGYPLGLRRHQIPLAARIFSVADAFDAMTHDRPYRRARSSIEALDEIERCAGTHFDPDVASAFLAKAGLTGKPALYSVAAAQQQRGQT